MRKMVRHFFLLASAIPLKAKNTKSKTTLNVVLEFFYISKETLEFLDIYLGRKLLHLPLYFPVIAGSSIYIYIAKVAGLTTKIELPR